MKAKNELFKFTPRSAKKRKGNKDEDLEASIAHSQQRNFKVQLFLMDFNNLLLLYPYPLSTQENYSLICGCMALITMEQYPGGSKSLE